MRPALRPQGQPLYDHLEAVALLTAMRDSQALNGALLKVVRELVPTACVDLMALCNPHNDREFHPGNIAEAVVRSVADPLAPEQTLAEHADFGQCVTQQSVISTATGAGMTRTVFPIAGVRYLTSLLAIEGPPLSAQVHADIQYLLRIYSNQRFLMNKGEFDALTGLLNRQAFDERMKQLMAARAHAPGEAGGISFAILDIDYFKKVNDQYGHLYGDEVLLLFAQLMSRSFRQCDLLFRYGGEEFAIIMTHRLPLALTVLERFRKSVEAYNFPQIGQKTVSIGVVEIGATDILSGVIDKADKALYHAKNGGRNRICSYESLHTEGVVETPKPGGDVELF